MCFAPQRRALFRDLNFQKWSEPLVLLTFWLPNVLRATTACTFSTSQLPKVVREWCVLYILTWKCASRHNGVHFFDISTSKSGPRMVCFVHFDLEMCFAPQRRALFRHLNCQKLSAPLVFCTFWLGNVLRATTACSFSTSQLPKVVREWCVLYIFTRLASWLRTRRFSERTFRPSGATNQWKKHSVSWLSYLFAHLHLLSSLTSKLPSTSSNSSSSRRRSSSSSGGSSSSGSSSSSSSSSSCCSSCCCSSCCCSSCCCSSCCCSSCSVG